MRELHEMGMLAASFINPFAWLFGGIGFFLQRRWFRRMEGPVRRDRTLLLWFSVILLGEISLAMSSGIGNWSVFLVIYYLLLCLIFGSFLAVLVYEIPAWVRKWKTK